MISSFTLKRLGPANVGVLRVLVAAAGVAALGIALYRLPLWLDVWSTATVVGAVAAAAAALVLAIGVAVRGTALTIRRVVVELTFFACALLGAEAILLARAPEKWPDDPIAQRMATYERAARGLGIAYDGRLRAEVVGDLKAQGLDAVPGFSTNAFADPTVAKAIRARELLPLSNASNVLVVECNEGPGYLQFRSDQFGFNNPPGVAAGPVDVAVIGESLALGHCVPPTTSAVEQVRARFPRTANFGIAGSRVLSQLAAFREYVDSLEPAVVVWFVNVNFAEARHELDRPLLTRYLNDASFSQGLRQRQDDVDSFIRDVVVPLHLRSDGELREEIEGAAGFPLRRALKLTEVRGIVDVELAVQRPPEPPKLSEFERAVDLVAETANAWGGRVIVVINPSHELSVGRPQDVARYEAVAEVLRDAAVTVVDGPALFAAQSDYRPLFTMQIDNHPSARGHALIGEAVIAAINSREKP